MVAEAPLLAVSSTVLPGVAVPLTVRVPVGCVVPVAGLRIATVGAPVTVKLLVVVAVPEGFTAVTVTLLGPPGKGALSGTEYVFELPIVMVAVLPPDVVTNNVLPGVAVPLSTLVPRGCVVPSAGVRIATVGGLLIVKLLVVVAVPLPLVAVAVTVLGPAGKGVPNGTEYVFELPIVTVAEAPLLAVSSTVLKGVAVPLTTLVPTGWVVPVAGDRIATPSAPGAVKVVVVGVLVPAELLVWAVTVCVPGLVKVRLVQVQLPVLEAVTTHGPPCVPGPPVTVTLVPGVAVPVMGGLIVVTNVPGAGPLIATVGVTE